MLRIQLHVYPEIESFLTILGNGLQPGQIGHQTSDVVLAGCSPRIRVVDELGRLIDAARVLIYVPFCRQQNWPFASGLGRCAVEGGPGFSIEVQVEALF